MQVAQQISPPPLAADRRKANVYLALLFWAFTYALFAYRANLRYGDAYELMSTMRLVSTGIGAGLYWLVLSRLIDGTRDRPGKPLAVLATILPASIIVLLARLLLDQLGAANPNGLAGDLRFVMVWCGYFGLWVSASFALRVMPRTNLSSDDYATSRRLRAKGAATTRLAANAIVRAERLERLASEIASLPTADRNALMESLVAPHRYEAADEFEIRPR